MKKILPFLLLLAAMYAALQGSTPRPGKEGQTTAVTVQAAPPDTLSDWELLQLAIAFTESHWNPDARGKAGDSGIYQIVPVYVREINRLSGYEAFRHEEATDIRKSIEMFNAMQGFYNPGHDIELAIHFHNKSAAYRKTVLDNFRMMQRYETLRAALKEYRKTGCGNSVPE